MIETISRSCECSITLCGDVLAVLLSDLSGKLLELIFKLYIDCSVCCKGSWLVGRNYISYGNVLLAYSIGDGLIVLVIYGNTCKYRCTVICSSHCISLTAACDCKCSVAVLIVLGLLVDLDISFLQHILEVDSDCEICIAACERNVLSLGNFIASIHVDLGYCICYRLTICKVIYIKA